MLIQFMKLTNSDVKNLDKETSEKFEKYLKLTSELQLLTEGTEC